VTFETRRGGEGSNRAKPNKPLQATAKSEPRLSAKAFGFSPMTLGRRRARWRRA